MQEYIKIETPFNRDIGAIEQGVRQPRQSDIPMDAVYKNSYRMDAVAKEQNGVNT